jgi:hypothetical protein
VRSAYHAHEAGLRGGHGLFVCMEGSLMAETFLTLVRQHMQLKRRVVL